MRRWKSNLMLALAAFIWGNAFVAQSVSMEHIGPWTFTCIRSWIAGFTLVLLMPLLDRVTKPSDTQKRSRKLVIGGIACGLALTAASMFQQVGIMTTTVGKAGFLTALYTIFVPLLGLLLGRKVRPVIAGAAVLSVFGFYLLSMSESLRLSSGDLMVTISALLFAVHILVIAHFGVGTDGVRLSCIQFFTVGVICTIPMLIIEHPDLDSLLSAALPILYAGILSSGAGYTLQIVGQKDADPSAAGMILSLESVFAALAGFILLHQVLSVRELLGCVLIFAAVAVAQLPEKKDNTSIA